MTIFIIQVFRGNPVSGQWVVCVGGGGGGGGGGGAGEQT